MPKKFKTAKPSKLVPRKRRTKPPPPGSQVPGSARLREIKVLEPELWEKLVRLVGEDNVNNHARGSVSPRTKAVAIYEHHAGIRSWHWLSSLEIVESEIAFVAPAAEEDT